MLENLQACLYKQHTQELRANPKKIIQKIRLKSQPQTSFDLNNLKNGSASNNCITSKNYMTYESLVHSEVNPNVSSRHVCKEIWLSALLLGGQFWTWVVFSWNLNDKLHNYNFFWHSCMKFLNKGRLHVKKHTSLKKYIYTNWAKLICKPG